MEKIKEKLKKIKLKQVHIALIVIGIILICIPLFHTNLWFDETYSVGLARHTMAEIWTIGGNDVHPILYYLALRIIYLITGGSIIAYRIFSAIPIAIMIILGYTHIRKDFGEKTGFYFTFLSIFVPEMAIYASEVRMYSWAILSVTILAIYAYRLLKQDKTKDWIIFGISSLVSIWLHYYGLMAAGLINVALLIYLIKNKRKTGLKFIIAFGVIQAVSYIPWLIYFVTQLSHVSSGFWIGFSFPRTPMELLSSQLAGYLSIEIPTVLSLELYAYMIYKTYKYRKAKENLKPFYLAVGMYFAVIIAALVMTAILHTLILYYRYLFVITGLYIFAISFILNKEENKMMIASILVVIFILGIWNGYKMVRDYYSSSNDKPLQYLEENVQETDSIMYVNNGGGVGSVAAIKFEKQQVYYYDIERWNIAEAYQAFGPNFKVENSDEFLNNLSGRIWVIDNAWGSTTNDLFKNKEGYKKVSEEQFYTRYHEYAWKITLLERK